MGVDESDTSDAALPVIKSWHHTFGRKRLADHGVPASWEMLQGGNPASRLEDLAGDVADAVLVTTSTHWTGPGTHWHSTTRNIAR